MKKLFVFAGIAVMALLVSGCVADTTPKTVVATCETDQAVDVAFQNYQITTTAEITFVDNVATTGTAKQVIPVSPAAITAMEEQGITLDQRAQQMYDQQFAKYEGAPGYTATPSTEGNNMVFDITFDFSVIDAALVQGMIGTADFMGEDIVIADELEKIHTVRGLTCTTE